MSDGPEARIEAVRGRYRATFGSVPPGIEDRLALAAATDRLGAVEAVERLRQVLLHDNPLGPRVQQLVHFAQLLALGRAEPARLHAWAAVRAGASTADLVGVAETALVTAGMPAYALGVRIVTEVTRLGPDAAGSGPDVAGSGPDPAGSGPGVAGSGPDPAGSDPGGAGSAPPAGGPPAPLP